MERVKTEVRKFSRRVLVYAVIIMGQVKAGNMELDLGSEMEDILSLNQIYYAGYPGSPLPPPGHKMTEQIPGYSHPYLPGPHVDINVKHFLWSGTGEVGNSVETSSINSMKDQLHTGPAIEASSISQHEEGSSFPTPSRHTANKDTTPGEQHRGNVLPFTPDNSETPINGYYDMPKPKYLIRTVIKNGTDLLKRSVDIQAFKRDMEERLTRTYRQAFRQQSLKTKRSVRNVESVASRRVIRAEASKPDIRVRIHNIRSARPRPEIEMLYAVYKHDPSDASNISAPVLAVEAVNAINQNVDNDDAVLMLGHPLKIKAEPYEQSPSTYYKSNSEWLIASIILAIFLALLIIWVIILIYRQYKRKEKLQHDILVSSVPNSKYASPSAPRKGSPQPYFDNGAYTLDRPKPKSPNQDVELERDEKIEREIKQTTHILDSEISQKAGDVHEDEASVEETRSSARESPSLADHSSNNTPDPGRRSKRGTKRRDRKNSRGLGRSTLTSDEDGSDSAFPARTPDNLRQLDDLLEEDGVPIPGDSGRGSCYPGQPGWAFLPATPEAEPDVRWQDSAMEIRQNAELYNNTLNQTFPALDSTRGASAKSHVVRKNMIESKLSDMKRGNRTRPWSAHESRWNADPMFDAKQRNWEGLAKGRKHLHHGQLLPGSTESEEEARPPAGVSCWSEGASPDRNCDLLLTEGADSFLHE